MNMSVDCCRWKKNQYHHHTPVCPVIIIIQARECDSYLLLQEVSLCQHTFTITLYIQGRRPHRQIRGGDAQAYYSPNRCARPPLGMVREERSTGIHSAA